MAIVSTIDSAKASALRQGKVIPAHPLVLDANRGLDERRQRALSRYYIDAGAGGLAVGVHTTQFEIREPEFALYEPVLQLAHEEMQNEASKDFIEIAGISGTTSAAVREATLARDIGYDIGLVSLAAMKDASDAEMIAHCREIADVIPVMGFYLQPAVGGRVLQFSFWRKFAEIEGVIAIKMAPFNRYQTMDVLRGVAESSRADEISLYTGNDDNIILDLLTRFRFTTGQGLVELEIVGGLLGHWAVWTRSAVGQLERCKEIKASGTGIPDEVLTLAAEVTDSNAAFFDVANGFAGCIAGIHEVLRRQGLMEGTWCINPDEGVSPGQIEEIDRIYTAYPHLNDDVFVAENRDRWLLA
ncbi:MAG: dihydrodipicolinate synthase family protein [Candidatus Latescibacterota bacterium]|nr:dihydrodipicolinate synthase family protein [Candidatus Latescibacterota bacterium]